MTDRQDAFYGLQKELLQAGGAALQGVFRMGTIPRRPH
jgi:hypothetical protein